MTYGDGNDPKVGDTIRNNHSGTIRFVRAVSDNGTSIDHDGTRYTNFVPAENWRLIARGPEEFPGEPRQMNGPRRFSRVFREKGIRVIVYADVTEATNQEHVADALLNACSAMRQAISDAMRPKEPTELGTRVRVDGRLYVLMQREAGVRWLPVAGPGLVHRAGSLPAGWTPVD